MTDKKIYKLPVEWALCGTMRVEASSLKEAIEKAYETEPLPDESYYIGDSFRVIEECLEESAGDAQ